MRRPLQPEQPEQPTPTAQPDETPTAPQAPVRSSSAASFDPFLLGFGLFLAWGTCMPQARGLFSAGTDVPLNTALVHACALVIIAVVFNVRKRDLFAGWTFALASAFVVATPLLYLGMRLVPAWALALSVVELVCEGVGRAAMFLLWVEQYSRRAQRVAWPSFAAAFALVPLCYFVVSSVPDYAAMLVVFCLPIASCLMLRVAAAEEPDAQGEREGLAHAWRFPWRPAALMAAFSFAHYMLLHLVGGSSALGQLGGLVVAVALLVACAGFFDRFDLRTLNRLCLPLMVCSLLMCTQGLAGLADLGCMVSYVGFNGFELIVLFALSSICFRYGVRAVWLFGMVEGCSVFAHMAGAGVGSWLVSLDPAQGDIAGAVDVVVVVLVLLSSLLLSERDFTTTWGVSPVSSRHAGVPGEQVTADADDARTADGQRTGGSPAAPGSYYEDFVWRCARVARHFGLTHREEEVLSLLAQNRSTQEIEDELVISHNTAKGHIQHVYVKLGVHARDEAAALVRAWR